MAPPKAKVMIRVVRGMLADLRRKSPSHDGMPPNSLGGGCHGHRNKEFRKKVKEAMKDVQGEKAE